MPISLTYGSGPRKSLLTVIRRTQDSPHELHPSNPADPADLDDVDRLPDSSSEEGEDPADIEPQEFTSSSQAAIGSSPPSSLGGTPGTRKLRPGPTFTQPTRTAVRRSDRNAFRPPTTRDSKGPKGPPDDKLPEQKDIFYDGAGKKPTKTYAAKGAPTVFKHASLSDGVTTREILRPPTVKPANSRKRPNESSVEFNPSRHSFRDASVPIRHPQAVKQSLKPRSPGYPALRRSGRSRPGSGEPANSGCGRGDAQASQDLAVLEAFQKVLNYQRPEDSQMSEGGTRCPRCPMCGTEVERTLLEEFEDGKSMVGNLARQNRFCAQHKRAEALDEWAERGYPDIDWEDLPTACEAHIDELRGIILSEAGSPFHEAVQLALGHGSARTIHQALNRGDEAFDHSITPGYYGFRGTEIL